MTQWNYIFVKFEWNVSSVSFFEDIFDIVQIINIQNKNAHTSLLKPKKSTLLTEISFYVTWISTFVKAKTKTHKNTDNFKYFHEF